MPTEDMGPADLPAPVSRHRLVRDSALAAGAVALGSHLDGKGARAQTAATPAASPQPGGRALAFDLPGLAVGVAVAPAIPTGCTVFNFDVERFPAGVMLELDVRGGAAWHSGAEDVANAICLAGGSVYGLEAAAGVAAELFAQGGHKDLAAVAGAVIFDVSMVEEPNGFRSKGIYPDKALGQAALRAAQPGRLPLGNQGAGAGAYVGQWANWPNERERGGQGGAYRQIGPIKIAVFTVVNALGVIVDRHGQVVRGGLNQQTGARSTPLQDAEAIVSGAATTLPPDAMARLGGPTRHTTLSVLVVNVAFPRELLRQLGRQVHSSMARDPAVSHAGRWRHSVHDDDGRRSGRQYRQHRGRRDRLRIGVGRGALLLRTESVARRTAGNRGAAGSGLRTRRFITTGSGETPSDKRTRAGRYPTENRPKVASFYR